ncbi:hypothetical protein [Vibrio harveyi]
MFDHSKGFGFVKADNGQDIFFIYPILTNKMLKN